MAEKRAYKVEADARYQGMVPGKGEVVVKTSGKSYSTTNEHEQYLLENTFGLTGDTKEDS